MIRTLENLPLKKPIVCKRDARVTEAIELMKQRHEGCVFIVDDQGGLQGVFSERDVTARVAARGRDPHQTRLEEVMTPRPVSLQQSDALAWALHRMGVEGYRHLPILDGQRLIGFLSARAVLQVLLEA